MITPVDLAALETPAKMLLSFVVGWYLGRCFQGLKTEATYRRLARAAGRERPGLEDR